MSKVRRWYTYNNSPGGQYNHLNYFLTLPPYYLPNSCLSTANNICAVKGIFSEVVGGVTSFYPTNPKPFAGDVKLSIYINSALAGGHPSPHVIQKPYVYVRNF